MSFLAFGGFIARLLGVNNPEPAQGYLPKGRSYAPVRAQFDTMNKTVDRISKNIRLLDIHEKRLYKLKKIVHRIERIERFMNTYEFHELKADYPEVEKELLDEIDDLRYKAKYLLNE